MDSKTPRSNGDGVCSRMPPSPLLPLADQTSTLRGQILLSGAIVDVDLEVSPEVTITTASGRDYTLALPKNSVVEQQAWVVALLDATRYPAVPRESPALADTLPFPQAASLDPSATISTGRTRLCSSGFLPSSMVVLSEAASKIDSTHRAKGRSSAVWERQIERQTEAEATPRRTLKDRTATATKAPPAMALPGKTLRIRGGAPLASSPPPWMGRTEDACGGRLLSQQSHTPRADAAARSQPSRPPYPLPPSARGTLASAATWWSTWRTCRSTPRLAPQRSLPLTTRTHGTPKALASWPRAVRGAGGTTHLPAARTGAAPCAQRRSCASSSCSCSSSAPRGSWRSRPPKRPMTLLHDSTVNDSSS